MAEHRDRDATIYDVAREAGVSVGTVSNVLGGQVPVREPTRDRVLEAMVRLGYRRNEVARALKQNTTRTLGVVIPGSLNPFFAMLTVEVERRARQDGFGVLVADTDDDPQIEADQARALADRRVDGVIFGPVTAGSRVPTELLDRGIPVVFVSFEGRDDRVGLVETDDFAAMEAVAAHLIELGHRRVAFLSSGADEKQIERRPLALRQALERRGLPLVGLDEQPTAICCATHMTAIALMDRMQRQGKRIPESISIVGFDDIPLAAHYGIDLTTVRQDIEQLGRTATELLLEAAQTRRFEPRRVVLPAQLVVRGSTGPAPAS